MSSFQSTNKEIGITCWSSTMRKKVSKTLVAAELYDIAHKHYAAFDISHTFGII